MIKSLPIEHSFVKSRIVLLGSPTISKFKRSEVGATNFSTMVYSDKFKEADCYLELDENFLLLLRY